MTNEKLDHAFAIRQRIAEIDKRIDRLTPIIGDDLENWTVQKVYEAIDFTDFPYLLPEAVKFLRSALKQIREERDRLQKTFEEL